MKKAIFFLLMIAVLATTLSAMEETKLKMELWNRWTNESVDGETTKNYFGLSRGYFRLEPKFNSNISGRFNVDFFSGSTEDFTDGAGLKIKYAYLDFAYPWMLKDSKLTVGLAKTYFGTIYSYEYTMIDKDPSDKYKFCSSADYGIVYGGYLPSGYGTYHVGLYNGEGYKKGTSDDTNTSMAFVGDLRLTPFSGIMVGGSYMMDSKNEKDTDDREDYSKIAVVGKVAYGHISVDAQYLMETTSYEEDGKDDKDVTVLSIMPVVKLASYLPLDLDLVGRYDEYDPNTDQDDDGESTMMFGFNWNLLRDSKAAPVVMVQANYNIKSFEDDTKDDVNTMMVQLRYIFSHKLK